MLVGLTSAAVTVAIFVLAGCTASAPDPDTSAAPSAVTVPDTPVGRMTQWVLDEMNADRDTDPADWADLLHPQFLDEVSADDVAELINRQIRPARPLVATAYRGGEREGVTTVVGDVGEPFDLTVALDDEGLITTLFLGPAASARNAATSIDEVADRWRALPGDVRVLVRRDDEDLIDMDTAAAGPIGSIFKLYVLAAVADAVSAGVIAWNDTVTVTDELRSLPSGELQDAATGTTLTVRETALKMISISDNTATDMLMDLVGRDAVERAVVALGHHDPALLYPFLTTREAFQLLWGVPEEMVQRWSTGDEAQRRALLEEIGALPFALEVDELDDVPGWTEGVEWFATPADVAAAHDGLAERAAVDPVIAEVLGANPGVVVDAAEWPVVAFKGGSSPGALAGSWRAVGADGTVLTVVAMLSAEDPAIVTDAQSEFFALAQDVFAVEGTGPER